MTKALICGGRDYISKGCIFIWLDNVKLTYSDLEIIQGGARGADWIANEWAFQRNIKNTTYKANWVKYGKAAGQIRNEQMLFEGKPNLIIAFPGGKGTQNMISLGLRAAIPTIIIKE